MENTDTLCEMKHPSVPPKKWLSFDQQLEKLAEHGMGLSDIERAKQYLQKSVIIA